MIPLLSILSVALSASTSFVATSEPSGAYDIISAVWCAHSLLWGILAWHIYTTGQDTLRTRWILIATLVASVIVLFPATDVLSDDAHRYRWDGWVQMHGLDPYQAAPTDSGLISLRHQSDGVSYPESINNNALRTIYPPGAQHVFAIIVRLCGTSPLGFKSGWIALCVVFVVSTVVLLWTSSRMLVLYLVVLLSPIFLLHGMMDIHVDIIMGLAVMLSFVALQRTRLSSYLASSIFGFSIALKYLPLLLLPAFARQSADSNSERLHRLLITAATIGIFYMPFMGSSVLGSLGVFTSTWQANSFLAWLGNLVFDPSITRSILMCCAAILMFGLVFVWREHVMWCCSMMVLTLMVFSPVVHAWYIALPLVLWVLAPSRTPLIWGITMCVYGTTYANYKGNGVWFDNPVALAIECIPVMIAYAIDVWSGPLLLGDQHRMVLAGSSDRE